jgi:23S rRNA (guanine1835-N2)-methyltransferase
LNITRYPHTQNCSLRAWSAADEHILKKIEEESLTPEKVAISNDAFGYLSCYLNQFNPLVVIDRKSQSHSIQINMENNGIKTDPKKWVSPLDVLPQKVDMGIINIPKSMEEFRLYLNQIHASLKDKGVVICSFMTRHFTPQMLAIANEYFEEADQSLAWKKSRLLTLKGKKNTTGNQLINIIPFTFEDGTVQDIKQYYGVFSSGNIDYATQFLLENLKLKESETSVLDLASGNGVIGRAVQLKNPDIELHLMDDSFLAIESSKLNIKAGNIHFHWNDSLEDIGEFEFDLVVSNPPFHFEHEVNAEISVDLFREVAGSLKPGGRFVCVANKHLGYKPHLKKFFTTCEILSQTKKFVVYESRKANSV